MSRQSFPAAFSSWSRETMNFDSAPTSLAW